MGVLTFYHIKRESSDLHHHLLWCELGSEDKTVDVVNHEPVVVFSHLTIESDLINHTDVAGEVADEVLLDDALNRHIGVESSE